MHSPPHSNPYAPNGNGANGDTREKLGALIANQVHLDKGLESLRSSSIALTERVATIERLGAEAIREVPLAIARHVQPLESRVARLESRWWEPLKPHLWKLWLALGFLAFAKGWKLVTGEPMPLGAVLKYGFEVLLRS